MWTGESESDSKRRSEIEWEIENEWDVQVSYSEFSLFSLSHSKKTNKQMISLSHSHLCHSPAFSPTFICIWLTQNSDSEYFVVYIFVCYKSNIHTRTRKWCVIRQNDFYQCSFIYLYVEEKTTKHKIIYALEYHQQQKQN